MKPNKNLPGKVIAVSPIEAITFLYITDKEGGPVRDIKATVIFLHHGGFFESGGKDKIAVTFIMSEFMIQLEKVDSLMCFEVNDSVIWCETDTLLERMERVGLFTRYEELEDAGMLNPVLPNDPDAPVDGTVRSSRQSAVERAMTGPMQFLNKAADVIKKRDAEEVKFEGVRRSTGEACSEWVTKVAIIEAIKAAVSAMKPVRKFSLEQPTFTHKVVRVTAVRVAEMIDIDNDSVYKRLLECAACDIVIGTAFRAAVDMVESKEIKTGWKPEFSVADTFVVTPEVEAYFQALRKREGSDDDE